MPSLQLVPRILYLPVFDIKANLVDTNSDHLYKKWKTSARHCQPRCPLG